MTGSAQVVVQALGFVCGILIVRRLPNTEYAYYTIATAMLSTMTNLSDAGISTGVIAQGGKVWQDPIKLGRVMATGMDLRRRFALISALAAPLPVYLMRKHDASWLACAIVLLSLIPTFYASLSDSLLETAPKLKQKVVPLQQNLIAAVIARTLLTGAMVFTIPTAAGAVLATGISRTWANIRLRKISSEHADYKQPPDPEIRKDILKTVYRILPTSLYSCFSGQVTIWAISIFGSTTAVSQLGGLTGLSQAMTIFSVLFMTLMIPRFARLPENRSLIIRRFLIVQVGLLVTCALIILSAYVFSTPILWLLGHRFGGLGKELTLAFATAAITFLSSSTSQMLSARGIVVPPILFIPFAVAVQVGLAFVLPLQQLSGALLYGLLTVACIYLLRLGHFTFSIRGDAYLKQTLKVR